MCQVPRTCFDWGSPWIVQHAAPQCGFTRFGSESRWGKIQEGVGSNAPDIPINSEDSVNYEESLAVMLQGSLIGCTTESGHAVAAPPAAVGQQHPAVHTWAGSHPPQKLCG